MSRISHSLRRIICLSAEAADWLWRIGAWGQVVGVTAFFKPSPNTAPKPRISGFSTARIDDITALKPDLVITFSDVQAPVTAELMRRGFCVLGTNQRTIDDIEATLALLGRIVDREVQAERLLREFRQRLAPIGRVRIKPRVYFEEWNEPLVSGIAWVSELIGRAGGTDIFSELRSKKAASERAVSSEEVVRRNPEVIFASWCGRLVRKTEIASRKNWQTLAAVTNGRIHEIPSDDILQPGFRLVFGYEQIKQHLTKRATAGRSA